MARKVGICFKNCNHLDEFCFVSQVIKPVIKRHSSPLSPYFTYFKRSLFYYYCSNKIPSPFLFPPTNYSYFPHLNGQKRKWWLLNLAFSFVSWLKLFNSTLMMKPEQRSGNWKAQLLFQLKMNLSLRISYHHHQPLFHFPFTAKRSFYFKYLMQKQGTAF